MHGHILIALLLVAIPAWGGTTASPGMLAPGELLFEFNDTDIQHDVGCGGTGRCLVAEIVDIVSPGGERLGTAREEVYAVTPKAGLAGAHVRARLFFTFVDESGAEIGRLETGEFTVDAALAGVIEATGQTRFNTRWDGTVRGTAGIFAGKSGVMYMRGHNVTHQDPATGLTLVDQFFNTYVVTGLH